MQHPPATNALLLAEDESGLALDRRVLRRIGVAQAQFFASGRKALDHLRAIAGVAAAGTANGTDMTSFAEIPVDLLICNERLGDMTGLRFLSHVRSQPETAHTPALLLVSNDRSPVAIAARATNSCAVLARPYTLDQALAALMLARLPEALHAPLVLPPSFVDRFAPFTEGGDPLDGARPPGGSRGLRRPLASPVPRNRAEAALDEGLAALQRGDMEAADRLLHVSYKADPVRVETCLALSRMHSCQHKEREEMQWLCKGIVLCLKRGEKTRAGNLIGRLPRGRIGQDPLMFEAGLALQEGETRAAALSFLEAHRLDPSRPLHSLIGRTCMFTPAPEEHMLELVKALSKTGHDATASRLQWRLLQPPREEEEEEAEPGFLANFPLLSDILSVAAHTFKTWRRAA